MAVDPPVHAPPPRATHLKPAASLRGRPPLYPHQVESIDACLNALHRFGGALLCDPVGSGKTRTALEVAARWSKMHAVSVVLIVAPAPLVRWWREQATDLGLRAVVVSMGRLSSVSSGLPPEARGAALVVVDEAHHMRHPTILRAQRLSEWIGTRACLMVTATPVVNSLLDLLHLGGYFLTASGATQAHVWRNIVVSHADRSQRGRALTTHVFGAPDGDAADALDRAAFAASSDLPDVAPLVRGQLWLRWSSSEHAAAQTLRRMSRYWRELGWALQHGRQIRRTDVMRHLELPQQAVLPFALDHAELPITAAQARHTMHMLEHAASIVAAVPWGDERRRVVGDWIREARPALVFTESADTAQVVTKLLARDGFRSLCLSGAGAWGPAFGRMPITQGLAVARGAWAATCAPPDVIVCTPAMSEGQNLQFASQIVHLDSPWNPGRVEQRVGRVDRLGAAGMVLERALVAPECVRARVDPWGTTAKKRADVFGWRSDMCRIAELAAGSGVWPSPKAEIDATWRAARALVQAGRDALGVRLVDEVAACWAAGPGRARRAAWPGVSALTASEALEWAAACRRDA